MKHAFVGLAILFAHSVAFAGSWEALASGEHSFKTLGEGFYVDVPVRKVPRERIQLSFVNRSTVEKLELDLPADPAAAEDYLIDLFGWEVDPTNTSEKKWFATHYQDGLQKGPGHAMGDGRALWTGELKLKTKDGGILYVDGVQKGVGPTPFAWLKNKTHADGKQNTGELIRSGIRSMADDKNQLDSTSDIIGFTITDESGEKRSMTLRVGRQTRPAHLRFHSDSERNQKKMMDYIVKRDIGLPIETEVTSEHFAKWARNFALNNSEDTARVYSLTAFFEQPTAGNKTTTGGSIDLNGRQYIDAYHTNLTYLFHRLNVGQSVQLQKSYMGQILGFLRDAGYDHLRDQKPAFENELGQLFDRNYKTTAANLQLTRLGLDQGEIDRIPPVLQQAFFKAADALTRAQGNRQVKLMFDNNSVVPAAFDMRKILRGTLAALNAPADQREAKIAELFTVQYEWAAVGPNDHAALKEAYLLAVKQVVDQVGRTILPRWISNADIRNRKQRYDLTHDRLWDNWAKPLMLMAESGKHNWVEISKKMEQAADTLIDAQVPERQEAMLKPAKAKQGAGAVRSCQAIFKAG